jgi:hypothetical protein
MRKIYKPIFFLFFLLSLSGFSQSITDDLFLKQDVYIRGDLTTNEYNLKGNLKIIITTAYHFDEEDGSKSKIGYCYAKYFSIQGLLTKEESYKTNDTIDKSIGIYYYTGIRLDSVSDFRKRVYRYDNQGRLKKIFFYDSNGENIDEEDFFYDNNNFINKVIQKSNKLETIYNYDKNGNITLMTSIHSNNHNGTQNEYLYDVFGDLSTFISNDKTNDIFTKTNYKRQKDKNNNLIVSEITVHSNKSKTVNYKSTYIYDSQGSLINLTSFKNNKKTDVYESKIVYYTADEINQKLTADTVKKEPINPLENVLKSQLLVGKSALYDEIAEGETYKFEEKDLQVTIPYLKSILKNSGFKFLDDKLFIKKIKAVFGRTIDMELPSKYLYMTGLDNCNKELVFDKNVFTVQIDPSSYYVIKKDNFITELYAVPQIIDYQKEYPEIAKIENTIKTDLIKNNMKVQLHLWKEYEDDKEPAYNLKNQRKKNSSILVARNMYLFNDNRTHFKWLLLNDKYFMQSLVTTFGYYHDKELLKWVVENTKFDSNNPNELDKIFWNKKCNGTAKLNLEIFPVLKEIIKPQGVNYFESLKLYVMYLLEDKDKRNRLSLQDRAKLLAHLVYFGEQYRYDKNYNDKSYFMQRIWMRDIDGSVKKEIIKNNYYNLPDYKKLYEKSEEYQNALADENGG